MYYPDQTVPWQKEEVVIYYVAFLQVYYGHKISPSKGAACAAYLHSKSAEINKDPASINSEDIIKELAFVLQKLRKD